MAARNRTKTRTGRRRAGDRFWLVTDAATHGGAGLWAPTPEVAARILRDRYRYTETKVFAVASHIGLPIVRTTVTLD